MVVEHHSAATAAVSRRPHVSWGPIFAGVFVAMIAYMILTALGMAIGGITAESTIESRDGAMGLTVGAGIWVLLSACIALFCGAYVAARMSNYVTRRVGAAHGIVVSSLFFVVMFAQLGLALGWATGGLSTLMRGMSNQVVDVATSAPVGDVIERAIGTEELKSPISEVAKGLAARILRGDTEAAQTYLAAQTGLSRSESALRIQRISNQVRAAAEEAGVAAARTIQVAGWTFFAILLLGTAAAFGGGFVGSHRNMGKVFAEKDILYEMDFRGEPLVTSSSTAAEFRRGRGGSSGASGGGESRPL